MTRFTPSRRMFAGLTAALALPLVLGACSEGDGAGADDSGAAAGGTSGGGTGGGEFPVTVDTFYGEITVEAKPERVVAIGGSYLDQLVALGVQPIAFVGSPRAGEDFLTGYPWFQGVDLDLTAEEPALLAEGYSPSLEAIAALAPDLIIGDGAEWAIDEAMFAEISLIAPTYTPHHKLDADWGTMLSDIAALTGTSEAAAGILADFDVQIEDARTRLENLSGATYVYGDIREQEIRLAVDVYMLEQLGLAPDVELAAQGAISLEQLDEVTSDVFFVMVWRGDTVQEDLEADPRYDSLPAAQNGAVIAADATLTNALEPGPLAFAWWLEQVVGQLESSPLNNEQ